MTSLATLHLKVLKAQIPNLKHRSPEIILPIPEIPEDLHHHHFPEFQPNSGVKMVRIPEIPEKIVIIPEIPEQFSIIPEIVFRK